MTAKDQNDFLKGLFIKYGPEPVTMYEPRKFLIKPRKCMRADEDVLSDYEEDAIKKIPYKFPLHLRDAEKNLLNIEQDLPDQNQKIYFHVILWKWSIGFVLVL